MELNSAVITLLKQRICQSWSDHDTGTPEEATAHYAAEGRLNPIFDNSEVVVGRDQIYSWFQFQRNKFSALERWDFQHRVMSFHIQPHEQMVLCHSHLFTSGQKREESGRVRTFMVPGNSRDLWMELNGAWKIVSREIQVAFAAYGDPSKPTPLGFPTGGGRFEKES
ncbi:MAG: hypothetical protein CBC13_00405 [Planctomycetia bacterium TMED53]|nr:MAG: hypothetical protein CBC13_00405 [Planctomycetia bacterium TMED53]